MKAVRLEGPGAVTVAEIGEVNRQPDDVLLKIELVGMCGSDLTTYRGKNPMVDYPRVIGHEVAATIVSGGGDLADGTAVTISPYTSCGKCPSCLRGRFNACQFNQTMGVQRDGAMTEYVSVPREKLYPARLTLRELCLVEPLTVGFHAAARGRVTAADTVAIFGCGGIGLGAIAASAFRGANTVAIDMDPAKLEVARKAGATHLIDSSKQNLHERLQEITGGRGPDVVVEAIGLPETFRAAVDEVAFTGRVVYIGYAKEPVAYETKLFVQKELDILGSRNALPEDFREVIRMLEAGQFPVDEAISAIVPMEDAARMLAEWSAAPGKFTKIIVKID
jgi:2-desacetyl-2-hydroxyethyl bacteriochlorophyllide A dehydrogenase